MPPPRKSECESPANSDSFPASSSSLVQPPPITFPALVQIQPSEKGGAEVLARTKTMWILHRRTFEILGLRIVRGKAVDELQLTLIDSRPLIDDHGVVIERHEVDATTVSGFLADEESDGQVGKSLALLAECHELEVIMEVLHLWFVEIADNDKVPLVRREAVRALARLAEKGDEVVITVALGLLADKAEVVRAEAVIALPRLAEKGDGKVITKVLSLLADKARVVRAEAFMALPQLAEKGNGEVIRAFLCLLADKAQPQVVRFAAVKALPQLAEKGNGEVIKAVLSLLADNSGPGIVREEAARALPQLVEKGNEEVITTVLGLLPAIKDFPMVRKELVRALAQLAEKERVMTAVSGLVADEENSNEVCDEAFLCRCCWFGESEPTDYDPPAPTGRTSGWSLRGPPPPKPVVPLANSFPASSPSSPAHDSPGAQELPGDKSHSPTTREPQS